MNFQQVTEYLNTIHISKRPVLDREEQTLTFLKLKLTNPSALDFNLQMQILPEHPQVVSVFLQAHPHLYLYRASQASPNISSGEHTLHFEPCATAATPTWYTAMRAARLSKHPAGFSPPAVDGRSLQYEQPKVLLTLMKAEAAVKAIWPH